MGKIGSRKYKHKPTGKMIKEIKQMAPGKKIGGQMVYPMSATRPYGVGGLFKAIGKAISGGARAVTRPLNKALGTGAFKKPAPTLSLAPSNIRIGSTVGTAPKASRISNTAQPYFKSSTTSLKKKGSLGGLPASVPARNASIGNSRSSIVAPSVRGSAINAPRYSALGAGAGNTLPRYPSSVKGSASRSTSSSIYQTAPSSARSSVASLKIPTNPRNSTSSMKSTVPTNPRNSVVSLNTPTNPRNSIASIASKSSSSLPSRISTTSLASSTSSRATKLKNFGKKIEGLTSKGLLAYGVYNALEDIEQGSVPLPQEAREGQAQPTTPADGVGYSGRQPNINNTKIINYYNGGGRGHGRRGRNYNPYQDNNSGSGFYSGGMGIAQPGQGPPGKYVENGRIYSS